MHSTQVTDTQVTGTHVHGTQVTGTHVHGTQVTGTHVHGTKVNRIRTHTYLGTKEHSTNTVCAHFHVRTYVPAHQLECLPS